MSWICGVVNCNNSSSNCPTSFKHDFPRSGPMRQKWLNLCGIKELSKNMKICRDHFLESDYIVFSHSSGGSSGGRLRPQVVPSQNLPNSRNTRSRMSGTNTPDGFHSEDSNMSEQTIEELKEVAKNSSMKVVLDKRELIQGFQGSKNKRGRPRSTDSFSVDERKWECNDIIPCKEFKVSDAKENKLPTITQAIMMLMNSDPFKYMGLSPETVEIIETLASHACVSEVSIIITFRKLKLDEDFSVLDDYFRLSDGESKQLFCETITTIAKYMQTLVKLPSKYDIFEDILVESRQKLCQTRFFMSHFHLVIEKTADLFTNESTFDGIKHLLHYLYLVTPDGYISFVSPGYGGRLSPEKIMPSCHALKEIINNGFHQVDLVPEFKEETPYPDKKLTFPQQIAHEVMRKMRTFALINTKKALDKDLIKYGDEIVIIIAALVNLQPVKYEEEVIEEVIEEEKVKVENSHE